jgi:hypothetical protein
MQPKLQFLNLSDSAPLTRIRLSFRQTSDSVHQTSRSVYVIYLKNHFILIIIC